MLFSPEPEGHHDITDQSPLLSSSSDLRPTLQWRSHKASHAHLSPLPKPSPHLENHRFSLPPILSSLCDDLCASAHRPSPAHGCPGARSTRSILPYLWKKRSRLLVHGTPSLASLTSNWSAFSSEDGRLLVTVSKFKTHKISSLEDEHKNRLGNVEYVVCRDIYGVLHCFHNVCRHHASLLAFGSGQKTFLECPYHGWTYGLDGKLLKATHITGIKNFNINKFGLKPIAVATWGPFVLIRLDKDEVSSEGRHEEIVGDEWLGSASHLFSSYGIDKSLMHVCRRDYTINCNWKVFCDNYLDGGYHVPYAHGGLASGLDLSSYGITTYEKVSLQSCSSAISAEDSFDRLGSKACYAFVYPNFMINRYGPWMDTNLVIPLGSTKCQVIFDYFLDPAHAGDESFIIRSLEECERVQVEDIELCEGVQRGLESPAYHSGRYAPSVEKAMHHFHCLLHDSSVPHENLNLLLIVNIVK